jgi:hypothetical protein
MIQAAKGNPINRLIGFLAQLSSFTSDEGGVHCMQFLCFLSFPTQNSKSRIKATVETSGNVQ